MAYDLDGQQISGLEREILEPIYFYSSSGTESSNNKMLVWTLASLNKIVEALGDGFYVTSFEVTQNLYHINDNYFDDDTKYTYFLKPGQTINIIQNTYWDSSIGIFCHGTAATGDTLTSTKTMMYTLLDLSMSKGLITFSLEYSTSRNQVLEYVNIDAYTKIIGCTSTTTSSIGYPLNYFCFCKIKKGNQIKRALICPVVSSSSASVINASTNLYGLYDLEENEWIAKNYLFMSGSNNNGIVKNRIDLFIPIKFDDDGADYDINNLYLGYYNTTSVKRKVIYDNISYYTLGKYNATGYLIPLYVSDEQEEDNA